MVEKGYRDLTVQADVEAELEELRDDVCDIGKANLKLEKEVRYFRRTTYTALASLAILLIWMFMALKVHRDCMTANTASIEHLNGNMKAHNEHMKALSVSTRSMLSDVDVVRDYVSYEQHLVQWLIRCEEREYQLSRGGNDLEENTFWR